MEFPITFVTSENGQSIEARTRMPSAKPTKSLLKRQRYNSRGSNHSTLRQKLEYQHHLLEPDECPNKSIDTIIQQSQHQQTLSIVNPNDLEILQPSNGCFLKKSTDFMRQTLKELIVQKDQLDAKDFSRKAEYDEII